MQRVTDPSPLPRAICADCDCTHEPFPGYANADGECSCARIGGPYIEPRAHPYRFAEIHLSPFCHGLPEHTTCWDDANGDARWKRERGAP